VRLRRLSASRAAFVEPLACAMLGIERATVQEGQTVVVFGHGPLGCLLGMVAAARKTRVILVGKTGWRLDRVRELGIGEIVDATVTPDVAAEVRARTAGCGADVTIDATGRPEVWEQAMDAVGRGGCVVFFGGCAPGTSVRVDTRRAHYEELTLVGAFHHTPELIRRAVEALEAGAIVPDGLVTHRMRLDGVHRALDLMANGRALKVLIEP
jgi:L-iditol 2-dehydrogenase